MPTESARNARKGIRNMDSISRSAGSNANTSNGSINPRAGLYGTAGDTSLNHSNVTAPTGIKSSPVVRLDAQAQDYVRNLCAQLRNPDFRERIEAIEKFQIMCETETEMASLNIVQVCRAFKFLQTHTDYSVQFIHVTFFYKDFR